MVRALLSWLALLALSPTAFAAAPTPPGAVLEACARSHAVAGRLKGLEQLETACPGLTRALSDLGLAQQLGEAWRGRLNPLALGELDDLRRYYDGAPRTEAPGVESLASVVNSLRAETIPH